MPKTTLPPDPEGRNDERAEWAALALGTFMDRTGADPEDAITDLLCDLAHYCDRNDLDFEAELHRAAMHYTEETDGEGTQLIYEPTVESPTDKAICGNCRGIYENESLLPLQDLEQRSAAGEEVPAGECPECGALCHLIKTRKPMQPIHRLFASVPVPGPPCVKCDNPNMTLRGNTWHCPECGDSYSHDPGP